MIRFDAPMQAVFHLKLEVYRRLGKIMSYTSKSFFKSWMQISRDIRAEIAMYKLKKKYENVIDSNRKESNRIE